MAAEPSKISPVSPSNISQPSQSSHPPSKTKRKRPHNDASSTTTPPKRLNPCSTTIQIAIGTYERILHGLTATIDPPSATQSASSGNPTVTFNDTFLLNAHASSIRCLAFSSPGRARSKRLLATGGADERINLYRLSTCPSRDRTGHANTEIGTLTPHAATVTSLHFPTSSNKLLSTSLDNSLAITRARGWTTLVTLRAPHPARADRPSGDTSAHGDAPSGIAAVALHPSARVAITVGVGERCMRLWNLVAGKKAGVLAFERSLCDKVSGGGRDARWKGAEAHSVCYDERGEVLAVAFPRGVAVFDGATFAVKAAVSLGVRERVSCLRFLPDSSFDAVDRSAILAVSTESGRILFFSTKVDESTSASDTIPDVPLIAQLVSFEDAGPGRIKDFAILPSHTEDDALSIISGSSDGTVRLYGLHASELQSLRAQPNGSVDGASTQSANGAAEARSVGRLLGKVATDRRITCLAAFAMGVEEEGDGDGDGDGDESPSSREEPEDEGDEDGNGDGIESPSSREHPEDEDDGNDEGGMLITHNSAQSSDTSDTSEGDEPEASDKQSP